MFLLLLVRFGVLVVSKVSQVDLFGCLGGMPCVVFFCFFSPLLMLLGCESLKSERDFKGLSQGNPKETRGIRKRPGGCYCFLGIFGCRKS